MRCDALRHVCPVPVRLAVSPKIYDIYSVHLLKKIASGSVYLYVNVCTPLQLLVLRITYTRYPACNTPGAGCGTLWSRQGLADRRYANLLCMARERCACDAEG